VPNHEVLDAALHADPARVSDSESRRRGDLGFPPAKAMAAISGPGADEFVATLGTPLGIDVLGPSKGTWLVRAASPDELADALARVTRPAARLRIEVDPLRV